MDDDISIPPIHPGMIIRGEMEEAGWTQSDLAYVIGAATATINQLVTGKRGISADMAKKLARAFNKSPERYARLQADWDLRQTAEPDPIVAARARVLARYPLREMQRRGWISETENHAELERQICRFFNVSSVDEIPRLSHSAKKTGTDNMPPQQIAWLFRVRQIAGEMVIPAYNHSALANAVAQFGEARNKPEAVHIVPHLLQKAGVRFVVVESLPGSKIDGVCFWLNDKAPVIGLSFRFDRIDNFWFVLRHECAHVLHGHGKTDAIVDSELESAASDSEEERIANADAAEFCVPRDKMESFYVRKNPLFSERDVLAFSTRMAVHPGLVVGQLQKKTSRFELLRRHLVPVRQHLAVAMMMDGWGDIVPVSS
jgi:HTH-type transcriptional regulator / antitoxin HigA